MTPAECWVPVARRWRHVKPQRDAVAGKDRVLIVESVDVVAGGLAVRLYGYPSAFEVDPDSMVQVLVPMPERDLIRELGAEVMSA